MTLTNHNKLFNQKKKKVDGHADGNSVGKRSGKVALKAPEARWGGHIYNPMEEETGGSQV
jgi:hypothetical protein